MRLLRNVDWLHIARLLGLVLLVYLIRLHHGKAHSTSSGSESDAPPLATIQQIFPAAHSLGNANSETGGQTVFNETGGLLGYVIQTSPASDSILGYSGPTNCLIGFDTTMTVIGIRILQSGDTSEHVEAVEKDPDFFTQFKGLTWEKLREASNIDAVSGATLTSLSITEGIVKRAGGSQPSLKFPEPVQLNEVTSFFPKAHSLNQSTTHVELLDVLDAKKNILGHVARTTPHADHLIGYQGPTDTIAFLDIQRSVQGIAIHESYETPEYLEYIREDDYFLSLFNGKSIDQLATMDVIAEQVEGVSGATMTSQAMADSLVLAASHWSQTVPPEKVKKPLRQRDVLTLSVLCMALALTFTTWRGNRWLRPPFQIVAIGVLGFYVGDFVSLAQLAGWTLHGIPATAIGLIALTFVAFTLPPTTKRQPYCHHICPHGAVQQLIKNRLPWSVRMGRKGHQLLSTVPAILLLFCLGSLLFAWPVSLANVEPFDAYLFEVAGWGSIVIAVGGLVFSLFVPMGYCRYGCPTGAILNYTRRSGRRNVFCKADGVLAASLLLCTALLWLR